MTLDGQICLVVGGVRGIGREITESLAAAGAAVIPTTTNSEGTNSSPSPWRLDVIDQRSTHETSERLRREYGRLDVLVYNAGIAGPTKRLEDITEEEWIETFEVNITGFYRICQVTIPLLRQTAGGRIIGIASMTGRRPLLNRVPYAASKTAMLGFARSLALELGPDGITVNTISPGYVAGERIDRVIAAQAQAQGAGIDQIRERFLAQSPLHRLVAPGSIARTVCFLADTDAQDITGADISVTAGTWME